MNEFRIRATGVVITEQELRAMHEKVFPAVIDFETALEAGIDPVLATPRPVADSSKYVVRDGVVQDALGNWVQRWKTLDYSPAEVVARQDAENARLRASAKADREGLVGRIKVTTSLGHTFDGDEESQTRMTRAIVALNASGMPSVTWVLADNSVIQATVAELAEALILAGAAQANMWVI